VLRLPWGKRGATRPPTLAVGADDHGRHSGFERKLIQARGEEGIQKARDQGKKFGRPVRWMRASGARFADRYADGETMAELARESNAARLPSGAR